MNRREIILTIATLPLIPYINLKPKYKTPPGFEPFEKLISGFWEEYPFDDLQSGDIIRRIREPEHVFKIHRYFPPQGPYSPAGFTVNSLTSI
jgi:hypothetical protein